MISNYPIDCPNDLVTTPINFANLGVYKTEERALELLDDINNIKFYKYMASLDTKSFLTIIEKKYSSEEQLALFEQMNTYQMPKE